MEKYCGCELEDPVLSETLGKAKLAIAFGVAYHDDEAINWAYGWIRKSKDLTRDKEDLETLTELSNVNLSLEPIRAINTLRTLEDKERKRLRNAFAKCITECIVTKKE